MSEWQPIKTAPKDETAFLAYCPAPLTIIITAAFWHRSYSHFRMAFTGLSKEPTIIQPTHWMPLPAPPTDQKEVMPNSAATVRHDNATPRPAHSPVGAELPPKVRERLQNMTAAELIKVLEDGGYECIGGPLKNRIEWIELRTRALAQPQVTDEVVERFQEWFTRTYGYHNAPTEATARDALTAALGKGQ